MKIKTRNNKRNLYGALVVMLILTLVADFIVVNQFFNHGPFHSDLSRIFFWTVMVIAQVPPLLVALMYLLIRRDIERRKKLENLKTAKEGR